MKPSLSSVDNATEYKEKRRLVVGPTPAAAIDDTIYLGTDGSCDKIFGFLPPIKRFNASSSEQNVEGGGKANDCSYG